MHDNLIWIRGEIIRQSKATVNVLSPMAQFGLNVFEGIRCYWNEDKSELYAFRLNEHLERLMMSCRLLRLPSPYLPAQIELFMKQAIQANDFQTDTAVRMTIFGDGQGTWNTCEPVSMFVAPMAKPRTRLDKIPALKACISSWERINDNALPPRAKVGANYINGRYAHLQARHDGYDVPIFLGRDGKVAEGAGACLFMLRNGQLVTPPTTSSVLESITRDTIMVLAREAGMMVLERQVDRTELYLADEVFLCGSAAEISPIVSVDGYVLGNGQPGPVTSSLLKGYLEVSSGETLVHPEWRTVVHRRTLID
ncbi:branched-chain-amino-acid transaminase [Limnohabitans sp. B9-3]|nr:branched-chain-amino-acid transaminase [Limnohabitans sp. B9-3]